MLNLEKFVYNNFPCQLSFSWCSNNGGLLGWFLVSCCSGLVSGRAPGVDNGSEFGVEKRVGDLLGSIPGVRRRSQKGDARLRCHEYILRSVRIICSLQLGIKRLQMPLLYVHSYLPSLHAAPKRRQSFLENPGLLLLLTRLLFFLTYNLQEDFI